jgi:dipeptide/tripeptide permease
MSLALLIIVLDTTILNVSLRTIVGDLSTTIQRIQWVITAYSLMLAAFTITGGRLGDLFGRKKMFILGAIIFAIGSFITSVSHSVGMMIFRRSDCRRARRGYHDACHVVLDRLVLCSGATDRSPSAFGEVLQRQVRPLVRSLAAG